MTRRKLSVRRRNRRNRCSRIRTRLGKRCTRLRVRSTWLRVRSTWLGKRCTRLRLRVRRTRNWLHSDLLPLLRLNVVRSDGRLDELLAGSDWLDHGRVRLSHRRWIRLSHLRRVRLSHRRWILIGTGGQRRWINVRPLRSRLLQSEHRHGASRACPVWCGIRSLSLH